jgi:16S rRNA (cytosine1402-N4)-methyltransferase
VKHTPVLLERCISLLEPSISRPNAIVVDATLGLGGHAEAMLRRFPTLTLIGIDRDTRALEQTGERLAAFGSRARLVHAVYDEIPEILDAQGIPAVDGVLFDLGVSSMQLDESERGFAYAHDAPLDMRMDQTAGMTAADVLNTYEAPALARILRRYGEEKFAMQIARNVVRAREIEPWTNSARLVELIRDSIPAPARRTGGNPAKRTFQALRIEVNAELSVLECAIPAALDAINIGGRVVVMAYQSLEDRIVKQAFVERTKINAPADLPVIPDSALPKFRMVTRGSEAPTEQEIAENSRAASARLRGIERIAR